MKLVENPTVEAGSNRDGAGIRKSLTNERSSV